METPTAENQLKATREFERLDKLISDHFKKVYANLNLDSWVQRDDTLYFDIKGDEYVHVTVSKQLVVRFPSMAYIKGSMMTWTNVPPEGAHGNAYRVGNGIY